MPLDGRQVYCSKNCAASVNNLNYDRHNRKNSTKFYCKNCSNLLDTSRKYCDIDCQYELLVKNWYSGEWSGSTQNGLSQTIRNHLLKKANFKCQDGRSNCQNWGMINPKSGKSCLQVEHIDGHYENNRPENLIVICPNCHSMTETYGGLNKGNGRPYRYKLK